MLQCDFLVSLQFTWILTFMQACKATLHFDCITSSHKGCQNGILGGKSSILQRCQKVAWQYCHMLAKQPKCVDARSHSRRLPKGAMAAVWQCCNTPTFAPKTSIWWPLCKPARQPCILVAYQARINVAKAVFWVQNLVICNLANRLPKGRLAMLPYACQTAKMRGC